MKAVRRKWLNLIRDNKHVDIHILLMKLGAISSKMCRSSMDYLHQEYRQHVAEKNIRKQRHDSREYNTRQLPPRSIKPTKTR